MMKGKIQLPTVRSITEAVNVPASARESRITGGARGGRYVGFSDKRHKNPRLRVPRSYVRLFRSLFRGRDDVYPRRFESRKTGKSGYATACAKEWVRGICKKPRIKCSKCRHRHSSLNGAPWNVQERRGEICCGLSHSGGNPESYN